MPQKIVQEGKYYPFLRWLAKAQFTCASLFQCKKEKRNGKQILKPTVILFDEVLYGRRMITIVTVPTQKQVQI